VEAPGFSPAKRWAVENGFKPRPPGLKPGSVAALSARLKRPLKKSLNASCTVG